MSRDMRIPRSTVGSYSKVRRGVLLRRSSSLRRACRKPCAASSPSRVLSRRRSDPSTLTKTRAWLRSGAVSTPVTVTKPTRESFRSPTASASTSRIAPFTLRIRSVIQGHHVAFAAAELERLTGEIALGVVEKLLHVPVGATHTGQGKPRSLPEVVMVDLRDRRPEPPLQLCLGREQLLPLAFQRAGFRKVELDREDADEPFAHVAAILPTTGEGVSRHTRPCGRRSRCPRVRGERSVGR